MASLRDYQQRAVESVFREWNNGAKSTLLVLPTGCGKTFVACEIARRVAPGRIMFLAHREELIFQAKASMSRFSGLSVGIEMADQRVDEKTGELWERDNVIVSTIQTQNAGGDGGGRKGKFDPAEFACVIVDEAHHHAAASWRKVVDYYRTNPDLRVLGLTATPDRADEEALGQVYDSVAMDYEILDAINDGWLVPIHQRMITVGCLDFSGCRTTAGDLNGADLAEVMEFEQNIHSIAAPMIEAVGGRKTLVFATSVAHAERMAEILNRHRADCASWICGKTPQEERRRVLEEYAAGKRQFLVNVGCLTEGFDDPGIEVIAIGRPTKSRSLYSQMIGRGTRPLPGIVDAHTSPDARKNSIAESHKPCVEVLDFCGNSGRHKLITTTDILGGKVSDEAVELAVRRMKETGAPTSTADALAQAEREIAMERAREAARRAALTAKANWSAKTIDPFDVFQILPTRERGWEKGKQLSDKQKDLLRKQGVDPDGRSYHECKQVLDEMFRRWDGGLCSFKQAKVLRKYGLPADLPRDAARQAIDRIAANNWQAVPRGMILPPPPMEGAA